MMDAIYGAEDRAMLEPLLEKLGEKGKRLREYLEVGIVRFVLENAYHVFPGYHDQLWLDEELADRMPTEPEPGEPVEPSVYDIENYDLLYVALEIWTPKDWDNPDGDWHYETWDDCFFLTLMAFGEVPDLVRDEFDNAKEIVEQTLDSVEKTLLYEFPEYVTRFIEERKEMAR